MRGHRLLVPLLVGALMLGGCAVPVPVLSDAPTAAVAAEEPASAPEVSPEPAAVDPEPDPPQAPPADPETTATSPLGALTYTAGVGTGTTAVPALPAAAAAPGTAHLTSSRTWSGDLSVSGPGMVTGTFGTSGPNDPQVTIELASDPGDGRILAPGHMRMKIVALTETDPEDWPHMSVTTNLEADSGTRWTVYGNHGGGNGDLASAEASWDGATLRFAVAAVSTPDFRLDPELVGWTHIAGAVTC
ncbi:hypothetical protein [Oerskovia sp. KBS0722]|uniref:hypothetical protein n=1 Tax=Oerskovia sp. KBS0722 TaxID=1179673 RepID=UPI001FEDDC2A|nr:hypothetical protein [Oerskovia sp. KBS0722]